MKNTFKNLGLSKRAITIYLELLQKGETSVENLSKSTGMNRTSIYPYIEELENFELILWDERTQDKALKAATPTNLKKIAKKKFMFSKNLLKEVDRIIPEIQAIHKISDDRHYVQKYVGIEECRKILEQVYDQKEMTGYCGEYVYKELGEKWYEEHLYKIYKVYKIKERVLFTEEAAKELSFKELLKTKWFDPEYSDYRVHKSLVLPTKMDVYILSDRVIYVYSEDEIYCIVMRSQKYRDYQNCLFEALWKNAISVKDYHS